MVGLVETLTVEPVEALSNLQFFFIEKVKLGISYFLKVDYQNIIRLNIKINPHDFQELID